MPLIATQGSIPGKRIPRAKNAQILQKLDDSCFLKKTLSMFFIDKLSQLYTKRTYMEFKNFFLTMLTFCIVFFSRSLNSATGAESILNSPDHALRLGAAMTAFTHAIGYGITGHVPYKIAQKLTRQKNKKARRRAALLYFGPILSYLYAAKTSLFGMHPERLILSGVSNFIKSTAGRALPFITSKLWPR